jgi:glyoxylase I family protein
VEPAGLLPEAAPAALVLELASSEWPRSERKPRKTHSPKQFCVSSDPSIQALLTLKTAVYLDALPVLLSPRRAGLPDRSLINSIFMFTGIEHFAIASPNPKALADWYVQTLEFRQNYEYQGNYFIRAQNGSMIEIIRSEGIAQNADARTPGMRHIAISVENFDQAHAELQSKGVEFIGAAFENQGNRLVFFKDRDGNLIHLIERQVELP